MQDGHKSQITDEKIVLYGHYKRTGSVILAVIATISLMVLLLSSSIKSTILNPNFYKDSLKEANTYSDLIDSGIPSLIMNSTISDNQITNFLAQKGIIYVIKNSIPLDWVEAKMGVLIDDITKYISDSHKNPKVVVRLDDMGTYLTQIGDGMTMLEQLIPSCAEANAPNAMSQLLNVKIDCKNMTTNLDEIKTEIKKDRLAIVNLKATQVDLSQEIQRSADVFTGIKDYANKVSVYFWTSLVIFIISLLLIVWLQKKNIYALIKYTTVPIASASAIMLLAALITKSSFLESVDNNLVISTTTEMQSIILNFLHVCIIDRFASVITVSAVLLAISAGVYAVSLLYHKKHTN